MTCILLAVHFQSCFIFSALAVIDAGVGETQMNDILADLNIPSPHHKTLKRREREAGPSFEKVADSSCDKVKG